MVGKTLSHYRILEKLGAGGMGEVYRAEDTTLKRQVALKVLPPDFADSQERLERFQREAETLAALDHPNIVTIYSVESSVVSHQSSASREGETENWTLTTEDREGGRVVHYLTMQLVEGQSLSELIPRGGMSLGKIFDIAVPLADALAAAHETGVIHRDLKPANIMVTDEGRVKVLDFGLAKLRAPAITDVEAPLAGAREGASPSPTQVRTDLLTEEGSVFGTVPYMSPEQAEGKTVDHRSDIFSLGVMLYEMATGRRPFVGDSSLSILSAILRERPSSVTDLQPELPRHLERIIEHCLEKKSKNRFQTARDVYNELCGLRKELESGAVALRPLFARLTSRRAWIGVLAALALAAAAIGFYVTSLRQQQPAAGKFEISSIAVLPLDNLMNDPEQEYFVDGMTEALIADLAQIEALRVISRTSTMRYKNTDKRLPQIARELNVDGIVEGSVLRAENRVRITAQLIHASTDRHIWAKSYERDLEDVLSLQKEVARAVAAEIRVRVTEPERDRLLEAGRLNPEAYESYLKGRWFWNRWNEEALWKGIELFNRAIELDAGFAPAYAGLADSYVVLSFYSQTDPREVMPKAKAAALKAVELDDSLAEAYTSLGFVLTNYDFDWEGAETAYRRAIELNPGLVTAHMMYMWYLVGITRFDEAVAEIRKAHELSPLDVYVNRAVGDALVFARRYDEAIVALQKAIEMDPGFTAAHFSLGRAYLWNAMYEEALTEFAAEMRISRFPDPAIRLWMGLTYAAMGRQEEAYGILKDLTQRSEREYVPPSLLASLHFALEQDDDGFAWLDAAYQGRDGWLVTIKADHQYDRVREDPRFQAFLKKMELS